MADRGPVIVVAPHPDDESLGCGGLLALAAEAGRRVIVAVMTDGAASHPHSRYDEGDRGRLRMAELHAAVDTLTEGRGDVLAFGASDGRLAAQTAKAAAWLGRIVEHVAGATLFVTWDADPHPDHKAAFAAAQVAATQTGCALWAYPIWSLILTDEADVGPPRACVRLDVTAHLQRKCAAIARHVSQLDGDVMADPTGFLLRPEDVERHLGSSEVFLAIRTA